MRYTQFANGSEIIYKVGVGKICLMRVCKIIDYHSCPLTTRHFLRKL